MKTEFLIVITIFIDIALIYILFNEKLNHFDKHSVIFVIFVHLCFLINIYFENKKSIDIIHVIYVLYVFIFSLFFKNKYLIYLSIVIIIMQLIAKYLIFGQCPMGKFDNIKIIYEFFNTIHKNFIDLTFIVLAILLYRVYLIKS